MEFMDKCCTGYFGEREKIDDLQPFDPKEFTAGLFGDNND